MTRRRVRARPAPARRPFMPMLTHRLRAHLLDSTIASLFP